jgi:hypothetical protein
MRRQQDIHEQFDNFDKDILIVFGEYYKAQGTSPAEMATSGLQDILIPRAE